MQTRDWRGCLILVCLFSAFLAGTGCGDMQPIQPNPCDPALSCAATVAIPNKACAAFGGALGSGTAFSWQAQNRHPTKKISVAYQERIEHLNQSKPDSLIPLQYNVPPAGGATDLGCEFIRTGTGLEFYDKYTFTPVTACFTDDPTCVRPAAIEPAEHDCSKSCNSPTCVKVHVNLQDLAQKQFVREYDKAVAQLFSGVEPKELDLAPILALQQVCAKRGHLDIVNRRFTESGSSCSQYLRIDSIKNLLATLPPRLAGTVDPIAGGNWRMDFNEEHSEPILEWFENSKSVGQETVDHIEIGRHTVKIVGKLHYCITIEMAE